MNRIMVKNTFAIAFLLMLRGFTCEAMEGQDRLIYTIQHGTSVNSVMFSPDGNSFLDSSDDNYPTIWNTDTGGKISEFNFHFGYEQAIFSPDGKYIAVLNSYSYLTYKPPKRDNIVAIFDVATQEKVHEWDEGGDANLETIAFSPDGTKLLIGGGQGIKLYDIATEQEILTFSGNVGNVKSLAFSPDGNSVVSGSSMSNGSLPVQVWDVSTGVEVLNMGESMLNSPRANSVIFSADGTKILAGGQSPDIAVLFNTVTGKELAVLEHDGWINSVAFSPDGTLALTGSDDKTAKIWDINTGEILITLVSYEERGKFLKSVAFSPDGSQVLTGDSKGDVSLWDVSDLVSSAVPPTPTVTPVPTQTPTPTPVIIPIQTPTLNPPVRYYREDFGSNVDMTQIPGTLGGLEPAVISWDTLSESSLRTGNVVLSFTVDENSGTLCFFAQSSPLEFNPETERILVRVRCRRVGNVKSHLFIGAIDANNMGQPLPLASYSDMQPNEGWEIIEVFHYPDSGFAIPLAQVVNYSDGNPNTNNQGEIQLDWIETEVVRRVFE